MRKILNSNYFLAAIYLFFAILVFGKLSSAFFQQDEWAIFGTFSYFDKTNLGWFERLFTYGQSTHTIPLSGLFSIFEHKLFGLNFSSYAYTSIAIHLINVGLVFYLAYLFFKKRLPAFIAGLLFLVDFIPSQAITWIATTSSTAGATLFTLLSLIFLTKFSLHKNENKFIMISFIFLFISLLFKESSIFMFLFAPLLWFVFDSKKSYKRVLYLLAGVFIVGALYVLPRLLLMLFNSGSVSVNDELTHPSLPVYIYRLITFPFKAITQSLIPDDVITYVAEKLILLGYPDFVHFGFPDPIVFQTIGSDIISYFFALIILTICLWFYRRAIAKNMLTQANIIIISLVFIALSATPLIFIPGKPGYYSFFDSRYLYMSSIFKAILLANIFVLIYSFFERKKIISIFLTLVFILFVVFNVLSIRIGIENEIIRGDVRKLILNQIQEKYPVVPAKVVFYTESDTAHYGLPREEKIMPFFSGFGQTLLVWYEGHGQNFPACFFQDKYLYAIIEQGYKECEGRGYGYFRKLDSLKEALRKYDIDPKSVISFRYTSGEDKLEDIGGEVRKELLAL